MKQAIIIMHFFIAVTATAQTITDKLPMPIPYKELQNKLYADGKVVLTDIQFDFKDNLLLTSEPQIKEISRMLNANKKMKIFIVVHADNSCLYEKCIELSQQRAEQIGDMLGRDYMVSWSQFTSKGLGPLSPVTTNTTEEGKKQNQRVEIVLQ